MVVNIGENIAYIREEMARAAKKSGRGPSEVKLMGVTKYHPIEMMTEAASRLDLIGENKVQEAAGKRALWPAAVKSCPWHMIGHLQRNKIRRALESFDLIESIDSLETAVGINRVLSEGEPRSFPVFIEVNISREAAKSGVAPEEAARLLDDMMNACRFVSVEGLMTVAENTEDEKTLRETFGGLRELREALRRASGLPLPELSMGMSGDFTVAIEEGSTIVRVGSAIFGPRNYG